MLNKPYALPVEDQNHEYICWNFCREIYSILGLQLQPAYRQRNLGRMTEPQVPCIVLFQAARNWHVGVVWPDGLHFIHASPKNIFDPSPYQEYIVQKDRLTAWPYNLIIEGYYNPQGVAKVDEHTDPCVKQV